MTENAEDWLRRFDAETPERRLTVAGNLLRAGEKAARCHHMRHEAFITHVVAAVSGLPEDPELDESWRP